ncbi:MAG: hypothetical protein M3P48_05710 [Actinomycetota bacterium]|nr:hypothetical protein [Actinomycetota bacterium]
MVDSERDRAPGAVAAAALARVSCANTSGVIYTTPGVPPGAATTPARRTRHPGRNLIAGSGHPAAGQTEESP